jgi:hypothetical protein
MKTKLVGFAIKNLLVAVTAFAAILTSAPSHASTLSFDFSFTNTLGVTPGTVTGQIYGLSDNATSAATAVIIDSYPAILGSVATPFDILSYPLVAGNPNSVVANSFTVAGGQITNVNFYADGQCLPSPPCGYAPLFLYLGTGSSPSAYVFGASDPLTGLSNGAVQAESDFITFTPTPLPATLPLFATGLGALGLLGWRRKREAI